MIRKMKKNFMWMIAAILFCGTMTTVFTSCGSDDSNTTPKPVTPEEQQEEKKAESADVTLTLVVQRSTLNIFKYDFKYVDAKGNTQTFDIDEKTEGVPFDDFEQPLYNLYSKASFPALGEAFAQDMQNPLVLRFTLKNQPTGKNYSYETICHIKEDFQFKENFIYVFPSVLVTETPKGGHRALKYGNSFNFQITQVTESGWERLAGRIEGKRSTLGSDDNMTVNE